MFRNFTTLALLTLTASVAASAPQSGTRPAPQKAQAKVSPAVSPDLQVDPSKFITRNLKVGDAGFVVNEAAKTVTVTVRNLGTISEPGCVVRLGIADAIDGTRIFLDQTKTTGAIPAGGSKTVTFTGLDFAAFKQAVVAQFGPTNGNKVVVVAQADPKKVIPETDETDNAGIKFLK